MNWFYPLIHLGFHPLLFMLIQLLVSSYVKSIIHKLDHNALKFKTPLCLYIYMDFWFVCYISFIKLDKWFIILRPSSLIYPSLPPHQFSTTRFLSLYLLWTGLRGPIEFLLLGGWVPNLEQRPLRIYAMSLYCVLIIYLIPPSFSSCLSSLPTPPPLHNFLPPCTSLPLATPSHPLSRAPPSPSTSKKPRLPASEQIAQRGPELVSSQYIARQHSTSFGCIPRSLQILPPT